jgi:hypothetical protein
LHTALQGYTGRGEDAAGGSGRWPSRADGTPVLEVRRTEGGGREQEVAGALKSRSTASRPLAPWSHGMAPEGMAPCLHATAPWLLASWTLTGFSPHHDGADVSSYDASPCGAVLCTYDAKALDAVHWVHSLDSFPQESICKNLTKKDQNILPLLPAEGSF